MNASTRQGFFHRSAFLAVSAAIAVVGCSSSPSSKPSTVNNESAGLAAPKCPEFLADCRQGDVPADADGDGCIDSCESIACSGKACGSDCSPTGSDEPFNCNAAGQCVANGGDIACRQCPPFLGDCKQGNVPADLDGDGCIDGCKTR